MSDDDMIDARIDRAITPAFETLLASIAELIRDTTAPLSARIEELERQVAELRGEHEAHG